jgi:hypothetical protein
MGVREVVLGRVVCELRMERRSVGEVDAAVIDGLVVELSGMRDCGGVSETLNELEPAPLLLFKSSILAGRCGECGVKCGVVCGGANIQAVAALVDGP